MPTDTVLGVPIIEALKTAISIAKDLTLTSFLLWVLIMMMTGRIVRREELTTAIDNVDKAEKKADWWRDKFMDTDRGVRDVLTTQGATIASLKSTLDAVLASAGHGSSGG